MRSGYHRQGGQQARKLPNTKSNGEAATRNGNIARLWRVVLSQWMSYSNQAMSINWRASLGPAAAVIPAPAAYTNAAAVKKLVVRFRAGSGVIPARPQRTSACRWGSIGLSRLAPRSPNAETILSPAVKPHSFVGGSAPPLPNSRANSASSCER